MQGNLLDNYYDENFIYLAHYQVGKDNLEYLSDFLEANRLHVLWRIPFSNDWVAYSDNQHYARRVLDYIFCLPNQNLRNFNKAYFLLEEIYNFSIQNLAKQKVVFLYYPLS